MKVEIEEPADIALRTLNQNDRDSVLAWFDHRKNWEGDHFVRAHSHQLPSSANTYVLQTGTDLRIFFTKDGDKITVFDVTKRAAILTSGHASGGKG